MSDISNITSKGKKLPPWAWVLIVAGVGFTAYFLYRYYQNSQNTVQSNNGIGLSAVPTASTSGEPLAASVSQPYSNNQDWLNAALAMTGSTNYTPLQVQTAVGNLENGNPLSTSDQGIINWLESELGAPPVSTPQPVIAPPAPKTTTSTVPKPLAGSNPWGTGAVFAVGSRNGSQYFVDAAGKPVLLSKTDVSTARSQGYNYSVVVVPSVKAIK